MDYFFKPEKVSQRQLRVGEEIRHILADVLRRETFNEDKIDLSLVTFTEVRISPDLRHAKVFAMTLGTRDLEESIQFLNKISPLLRNFLAKRLTTKFVPKLFFIVDKSYSEAEKIDRLLKSPQVLQDLKKS